MAFLPRLQGILREPKREWPQIAAEPTTLQGLYAEWIMLVAAIGPLCWLAGGSVGVRVALLAYIYALVGVAVIALVVDLLAPSFGGSKDYLAALKLTAYSATATWIAQIALLLPVPGALVMLAAAIYSVYTFFLGAPVLGKCAPPRALMFTIVVLLCVLVLGSLIRHIVFGPLGAATMMGGRGAF